MKILSEFKALMQASAGQSQVNALRIASATEDGETITIGDRVYEIDTDDTVTGDNIAIDLSQYATAAARVLTVAAIPTAGDTVTIGATVYTFQAAADAEGEVTIGGDAEESIDNLVAAINGTDDFNDAHPTVTAAKTTSSTMTATAITPGTDGNSIATTETFTEETSVWAGVQLTGGVDPTAANSRTGIAAGLNADGNVSVVVSGEYLLCALDAVGSQATATTETLAGANNAWLAADAYGGRSRLGRPQIPVQATRAVTAAEDTAKVFLAGFGATVESATVQVRTAAGVVKAWDGKLKINGQLVIMESDGSADVVETDVVTVSAVLAYDAP